MAMAVGLPAGTLLGLGAAVLLAPPDFPRFDPKPGDRFTVYFAVGPRQGAADPAPAAGLEPDAVRTAAPGYEAGRQTLLRAHADFLRRERLVSAVLDRYRPTVTRSGRRATPQIEQLIERTRQAHARAREALRATTLPAVLAHARAATLAMLEAAEAAHAATLDAGRRKDPNFALARESHYEKVLAAHYSALAALRARPAAPGVSAGRSTAPATRRVANAR
jgi:hypothetical protein